LRSGAYASPFWYDGCDDDVGIGIGTAGSRDEGTS
jgi:hypothetical protein